MRTKIIQNDRMTVSCDVMNGWTVLRVEGDVDVHTSPMIREAVIKLLDEGRRHFILDLRLTPFLDSRGLGMIVAITKRIRDHEGSLRITCAGERILKVFKISGLRAAYEVYDSPEAASRRAPSSSGLEHWPRSKEAD
ncbi:STAS domain-containing protein [Streptomyces venetus]|uniref:STAS domain-containing protein n=1 Tax=Streptomyces venetus TaxID=1701086 RepID=UPI003C2BEDF5